MLRFVVSAAEGIANIVDQFVETDDEKRAAELIKAKLMMKPSLAQIELNKIEAGHWYMFGACAAIPWAFGSVAVDCAFAWSGMAAVARQMSVIAISRSQARMLKSSPLIDSRRLGHAN